MYERFTDHAQEVMRRANQEAKRLHQEFISPVHILLGLFKHNAGTAAEIMRRLNIDPQVAVTNFEKTIQTCDALAGTNKLCHVPRGKKVIERATEEARALHHNYVGTEHLLLGLLRDEDDIVAPFLASQLGLTLDSVRRIVREITNQPPEPALDALKLSAAGQILYDLLADAGAVADEHDVLLSVLSRPQRPSDIAEQIACVYRSLARDQILIPLRRLVDGLHGRVQPK